jgi:hypothetical protein
MTRLLTPEYQLSDPKVMEKALLTPNIRFLVPRPMDLRGGRTWNVKRPDFPKRPSSATRIPDWTTPSFPIQSLFEVGI